MSNAFMKDVQPNLNLVCSGKTINYAGNTSKETIYKPTGNEKEGTDSVKSFIEYDSNYMTTNSEINGFFSNIYSTSAMEEDAIFETPTLKVKVNLAYRQTRKLVDAQVQFKTDGQTYSLLNIGGKGIFDNNTAGNKAIKKLWSEDIFNTTERKDTDSNKKKENKGHFTLDGYLIQDYYVYIIADGQNMIHMLDRIANSTSASLKDKLLAIHLTNYIATYNPQNYTKTTTEPDYVFTKSSKYTYTRLYNLISKYYPECSLPDPKTGIENYMKITKVDILSAAKQQVDVNFLYNSFSQKDVVISNY